MNKLLLPIALLAYLILPQVVWTQSDQMLTAEEKSELLFMMEEEKMARDVYVLMYDKWDKKSFDNISKAEQKHLDKLKEIAGNHDLQIPQSVVADKPGKFDNKELQNLYNELIAKGNSSLGDALEVGINIEETDIEDLKQALEVTKNTQLVKVYTKLLEASNRHLTAFQNNLKKEGISSNAVNKNKGKSNKEKACCKEGESKDGCKHGKAEKTSEASTSEKECCKDKAKGSCKSAKAKS